VDGEALISHDVLASYAADAASEVPGVRPSGRRAVRITGEDGRVAVELHVTVDWGVSIPDAGAKVQRRVREYLAQMADVTPAAVEVVVDEVS
jgi:uncharacterized alkaline shock family protein YloU